MASLNHVCMWTEHGWQRITAEQASALHPGGTVSAHSGLFMCELCGQYVTLTDGYERVRYFKHSSSEADKACPERTFGTSYIPQTYKAGEHELPIRLVNVSGQNFSFEIGFLFVPSDLLQKANSQMIIIKPSGISSEFQYSFERLNSDSITYLSVGNIPARSYQIITDSVLSPVWPQKIHGIDPSGAVFAANSGRLLGPDSDVQVNRKYYCLLPHRLYRSASHIQVREICRRNIDFSQWYLYEIIATAYEADAAKFFLDLHCRLTDSPAHIQPVWPPYAESPYVIRHSKERVYIHIRGQNGITAKTFPEAANWKFELPNGGFLLELDCKGRQQLISAGRAHVQQYTYLWKEPLSRISQLPSVNVVDIHNKQVLPGILTPPPEREILQITTPFDGYVTVYKNHVLINKIPIKAEHSLNLEHVGNHTEIHILQGLDTVWKSVFDIDSKHDHKNDQELFKKLQSFHGPQVPASHTLGSLAIRLQEYPSVKQWLYRRIRMGTISQDALHYLQHFLLHENKK